MVLKSFDVDITKRRFESGDGLFKKGIKVIKNLHMSQQEQIREIRRLPGVTSYDPKENDYYVNLGWAGNYHIYIEETPRVYRKDKHNSEANPFIGSANRLCLGNSKERYNKCYNNHNYLDCAILINLTLSCRNDSKGYRGQKWRDL